MSLDIHQVMKVMVVNSREKTELVVPKLKTVTWKGELVNMQIMTSDESDDDESEKSIESDSEEQSTFITRSGRKAGTWRKFRF